MIYLNYQELDRLATTSDAVDRLEDRHGNVDHDANRAHSDDTDVAQK
jgi:hypothetical protein